MPKLILLLALVVLVSQTDRDISQSAPSRLHIFHLHIINFNINPSAHLYGPLAVYPPALDQQPRYDELPQLRGVGCMLRFDRPAIMNGLQMVDYFLERDRIRTRGRLYRVYIRCYSSPRL